MFSPTTCSLSRPIVNHFRIKCVFRSEGENVSGGVSNKVNWFKQMKVVLMLHLSVNCCSISQQ